jgi:hypothetical protein
MSALDGLFDSDEPEPVPPEARRWQLLSQGKPLVCEFLRRRDGLTWGPARLQVSIPTATPPVIELPVPWDLSLDNWLIEHKARAPSHTNEAERFGFRFNEVFQPIEQRYGDGYFNAVLVHYLRDTFVGQTRVMATLDEVHSYRPNESESAVDCRERIERVLAETAQTLTKTLGYQRPVAEQILSSAIAYYLDERFNISNRRFLGLH